MSIPEPQIPFIDQRQELTAPLDRPITDSRAWTLDDLDPDTTITYIPDDVQAEILALAKDLDDNPLPVLMRSPDQVKVPTVKTLMEIIGKRLKEGPGFGVVDRLPLDDIGIETATAIYWIVGQMIGRPVAETWDGKVLFDVMDTGKSGYGVRTSLTNFEILFHTDNGFNVTLPDTVGLLCVNQAKEGGVSRFCSLYSMHNRLLEKYPNALKRLYRPVLFDRMAEHAEGEEKIMRAPVFQWDGHTLSIRPNIVHIRNGYKLASIELDAETSDALDALSEVATNDDLWVEMRMERGQLQFLNNRGIVHFRSAYVDYDDPELKRRVIRTWYREAGRPTYNG